MTMEPSCCDERGLRVVAAPRSAPQCLLGAPLDRRRGGARMQRSGGGDSSRSLSPERDTTQAHEQSLLVRRDLLERDAELAVVAGLIDTITDAGRLLAIEGPPGIGKTALMAEARALAQEAGLQVLGARGSGLERSFSYGVVAQLFET